MIRLLTWLVVIVLIVVAAWTAPGARVGIQTDYFKRVSETK